VVLSVAACVCVFVGRSGEAKGVSALGVGELSSVSSVCMGTTGMSVYSRDGDEDGAHDPAQEELREVADFPCRGLTVMGNGWGFFRFVALPRTLLCSRLGAR